jgi:hypothetical protein
VQAQAQHVEGRLEQLGRCAGHQRRHRAVVRNEVPVAVDREGRIRLVPGEHRLDRPACAAHRRVIEAALAVHRRIARCDQQSVALAQRHVEAPRQAQHHLAAGRGTTGLDIAEMPRRDLGLAGELELAEVSALAPVAQQGTDGHGGGRVHGGAR